MPIPKETSIQRNALGRVEILRQLKKFVNLLDVCGWSFCPSLLVRKDWGILDGEIVVEGIGNDRIIVLSLQVGWTLPTS